MTVRGTVPPEALGTVAMHEHLWCDSLKAAGNERHSYGTVTATENQAILDDFEAVLQDLRRYKSAGGGSFVEMSVTGLYGDPATVARLSDAADVHVIAAAGFYVDAAIPEPFRDADVEQLTAFLYAVTTRGFDNTGIRPGVLKASASGPDLTALERRAHRAVAKVHLLTGLPVSTHSASPSTRFEAAQGTGGLSQLDLLEDEGVDPSSVIIGHCDVAPDIRIHRRLAARGCYIQYDCIGKEHYVSDTTRTELICALIEKGFANQILLSSDRCRNSDLSSYGGLGYSYLLEVFVPMLRGQGLKEEVIHRLLITNPARALTPTRNREIGATTYAGNYRRRRKRRES